MTLNPPPAAGSGASSTRERLEQKHRSRIPRRTFTLPQRLRGYLDALVFAFLLAMFIRSYVFELFMIPTGSMTPTLIGDVAGEAAFLDYNDNGILDVVYTFNHGGIQQSRLQVFLMNEDGTYRDLIFLENVDRARAAQIASRSPQRRDMIIVNKFAYWFRQPRRGDISVFKVPDRPDPQAPDGRSIFHPEKPVYIKRVIVRPGETVVLPPMDTVRLGPNDPNRYSNKLGGVEVHLRHQPVLIEGEPLTGGRFDELIYFPRPQSGRPYPMPTDPPTVQEVPPDGVLMLGDNSASSSDGRYWGDVPLTHLRGKAVLRYAPLRAFGFLR